MKRFLAFVLIVALAGFTTGCGNQQGHDGRQNQNDNEETKDGKTTGETKTTTDMKTKTTVPATGGTDEQRGPPKGARYDQVVLCLAVATSTMPVGSSERGILEFRHGRSQGHYVWRRNDHFYAAVDAQRNRPKSLTNRPRELSQKDRIIVAVGSVGHIPRVHEESLSRYYKYLTEHLCFPFIAHFPKPPTSREEAEFRCTVWKLLPPAKHLGDGFDGIFCNIHKGIYEINLPLIDLYLPEDCFQLSIDRRLLVLVLELAVTNTRLHGMTKGSFTPHSALRARLQGDQEIA